MSQNMIKIEDLLKEQDTPQLLATVEAVDGKDDMVKVTPWTRAAGCLCHLAINVKKASLEGASPTGDIHVCCGKNLKVVELHFKKNETVGLNDLFQQMHDKAKVPASVEHHHNASLPDDGHQYGSYRQPQMQEPNADSFYVRPGNCLSKFQSCIRQANNDPSKVCWCLNYYKLCTGENGLWEPCPNPRRY